jgi:predicted nucleic acid-binding protein
MSRYLLDTNVVSELRKAKPHGAVISWFRALSDGDIFVSAVTIGELQAGVERARRNDAIKAVEIEAWVDQIAEDYQVLPMDTKSFREWGRLSNGVPEHLLEDLMIAAAARVHDLIVATRNVRHFKQLGVRLFNPFESHA